jgi:hypothetical protein
MDKVLRMVLLLALSLAIPMYGVAGVLAPQATCPMQGGAMNHAGIDLDSDAGTTASADPCGNASDVAESGQACQSGQECSSVHVLHVPVLRALAVAPGDLVGPPRFSARVAGGSPPSIWRPPVAL